MLSAIRQLFSKPANPPSSASDSQVESVPVSENPIRDYFMEELRATSLIKAEAHPVLLRHLSHEINLNKTGNLLTTDEKKALGLNPKLKLTREIADVLTEEGLRHPYAGGIVAEIYTRATIRKSIDDNFRKALSAGLDRFKLMPCGDGSECAWCSTNQETVFGTDVLRLKTVHCTCPSPGSCLINPALDDLL